MIMRENGIRRIWAGGGNVVNGWLAIPSPVSAELMAHAGWDSLCVDLQHGAIDYQVAVTMLQAISTTATVPLVRVPWNDPAIIGKLLDAGAYGVICPMVNSRAEAEAFVGACRYAPQGYRSVGPLRATLYGGADYVAQANNTILTLAMIETRQAIQNLEEILATPGLDAVYVGPSDLSVSMGHSAGFDPEFPDVLEAILRIPEAAKRHGVIPGIHVGSVAYGTRMYAAGFRFTSFMSDFRFLQWITARAIPAMRGGKAGPETP
jgi:4-hydroxy-2-oxoheptanedioate aldolase